MKEKQNAKTNLLHKTNSKNLEICLHTWNFLMIQECIIMVCPVKMTSRVLLSLLQPAVALPSVSFPVKP